MFIIVHISDIHFAFHGAEDLDHATRLAEMVTKAMRSVTVSDYDCLFLATGDISAHGCADEFRVAEKFFKELMKFRDENSNGHKTWVLVVPGNHDCNLSDKDEEEVRDTFLLGLAQRSPTDGMKRNLLKWQSDFNDFQNKLIQMEMQSETLSKTTILHCTDEKLIRVVLLNSAWMSTRKENKRELIPPDVPVLPQSEDMALRIAAFHHPYAWYKRGPDRNFRSEIESVFDIVLTGHEHFGESTTVERRNVSTLYLDGELFVDEHYKPNAFRIVKCDLSAQSAEEFVFHCSGSAFVVHTRTTFRIGNSTAKYGRSRHLSTAHIEFLENPGAQIRHPHKDEVSLDDLFVSPTLRYERPGKKNGLSDTLVSWSWKDIVKQKTLIFGPQHSGRTSICKQAFREAFTCGLFPVILDGRKLKKTSETFLKGILSEAYARQYSNPDKDTYEQLDSSERAIIVDDWDACPIRNRRDQSKILELLGRFSDRLLVCACDTFLYDVTDEELAEIITTGLEWYRIVPFGHAKRELLARKWIELGQTSEMTEGEIDQSVAEKTELLDSLIGSNVVPPFPFVLLLFLSLVETEVPASSVTGSYGYLYDALMTKVLGARHLAGVSMDTQMNYLADLAYYLQRRESTIVDTQDALRWHRQYCSQYRVNFEFTNIIDHLKVGGVLSPGNGDVGFQYAYTRVYYVARYLGKNIDKPEVLDYISFLANRVHLSDAANILMFLCYHTRNPFIIETLIAASRSIFSRYTPCDLSSASALLCGLAGAPPNVKQELKQSSPSENRIERAREIDDHSPFITAEDDSAQNGLSSQPSLSEMDEVFQIAAAIRSIQLLGQILRNFSGSTMGDIKAEIAFECYSIGLRMMEFFFSHLRVREEEILARFGKALKKRFPSKIKSEREAAANFLYMLLTGVGWEMVELVVASLGQRDLIDTYADVIVQAERKLTDGARLGIKIIDVVMHMRQGRTFPQQEVLNTHKSLSRIAYGKDILRMCVRSHLDYRTVPRPIRQSICEHLDIGDPRIQTASHLPGRR
jgi:hypothetical protein